MTCFAIRFVLQAIERIEPWGQPGDQSLGWFGLTYGGYCIETPQGRLLETPEPEGDVPEPWVNYQVARLFDDLLSVWPAIAEPVPQDIAALIHDGNATARVRAALDSGDDELIEAADTARAWFRARQVSMMHLASDPDLHLWRTGDAINLRWVANPSGVPACDDHWTVRRAECSVAFDEAADGVRAFAGDFLDAMRTRVEAIRHGGWTRDCALDVDGLLQAQRQQEEWGADMLARIAHTDWDSTRAALRTIDAL